jgi:hypothetical protein
MKLKGLEVGEELFAVSIRANPNEKERDCARRVFTNYLRSDIGMSLFQALQVDHSHALIRQNLICSWDALS